MAADGELRFPAASAMTEPSDMELGVADARHAEHGADNPGDDEHRDDNHGDGDHSVAQRLRVGRMRATPLIAAMAAISALIGAGTSFSELYLRIQGGQLIHVSCPVIGARPTIPTNSDHGLCVTSPTWFGVVTLSCMCLAALLAIALTHTSNRLVDNLHEDDATATDSRRAAYLNWTNFVCLSATFVVVAILAFVSGNATAAAFVVFWWLAAYLVTLTLQAVDQLSYCCFAAVLFGMTPALLTQGVLVDYITASGGVKGSIIGAFAIAALVRVSMYAPSNPPLPGVESSNSAQAQAVSGRPAGLPHGMISQLCVLALTLQAFFGYRLRDSIGNVLCPAIYSPGSANYEVFCLSEQSVQTLIELTTIAAVLAVALAVAAVILLKFTRWREAMVALLVSSTLAGMVFVVSFTFA